MDLPPEIAGERRLLLRFQLSGYLPKDLAFSLLVEPFLPEFRGLLVVIADALDDIEPAVGLDRLARLPGFQRERRVLHSFRQLAASQLALRLPALADLLGDSQKIAVLLAHAAVSRFRRPAVGNLDQADRDDLGLAVADLQIDAADQLFHRLIGPVIHLVHGQHIFLRSAGIAPVGLRQPAIVPRGQRLQPVLLRAGQHDPLLVRQQEHRSQIDQKFLHLSQKVVLKCRPVRKRHPPDRVGIDALVAVPLRRHDDHDLGLRKGLRSFLLRIEREAGAAARKQQRGYQKKPEPSHAEPTSYCSHETVPFCLFSRIRSLPRGRAAPPSADRE